jgi:exopolysaccharide biosynthesis predicted pyruvyltransferase EpsI
MSLSSTLAHYQNRPFLLVRPGGNFGDQLIYIGMSRIVRDLNINSREISFEEFSKVETLPPDTVVYVHGGGGYVPWWSGKAYKAVEHALSIKPTTLIVGPTTLHSDESYIAKVFDGFRSGLEHVPDVHFFLRDKASFQLLKRLNPAGIQIDIDDDTAISSTRADILAHAGMTEQDVIRRRYALFAIRQDAESPDTSKLSPLKCPIDPVNYARSMKEWVLLHACAGSITTNRLHSAIGGMILGIPTTLLPNGYHKNRSVWEYSLSRRNVQWQERLPTSPLSWVSDVTGLSNRLSRSNKLQRCVGAWYFGT